jgi:hypothetical protein
MVIYAHWAYMTILLFPFDFSPAISVNDYSFGNNKIEEYLLAGHDWHEA